MNKKNKEKICITGCAGFIGMHLCEKLISLGYEVIGLDNLNDYYDVNLKLRRLSRLKNKPSFNFVKIDITNLKALKNVFKKYKPEKVVNLAAQAGVRYSLKNPKSYIESNLIGFFNIIENCRLFKIKNFIYASSSSVYGGNRNLPYSEINEVNQRINTALESF